MDISLDNNVNNPFVNSNASSTTNNTITKKTDGLLLDLSENFKQNGQDVGKRLTSELFDNNDIDDDLGPETNVDDILSPSVVAAKQLADGLVHRNLHGSFKPFVEKDEVEKAAMEFEFDLEEKRQKQLDNREFEFEKSANREETLPPSVDIVHDGGLVIDNFGDSGEESEDEWNYFKGEEANKENISPTILQPDAEVAQLTEEFDNMSQLNPNAAEFVPVSPTRSIPSPACRALMNDPVIAQSPKRPPNNSEDDDNIINLPTNPEEFEIEVKSRPSDIVDVFSVNNGRGNQNDQKTTQPDLMENILNGRNIDEIPEFQPITPTKVPSTNQHEEFHFGPNATPFTPVKLHDESEAGLSTKAVYGGDDETIINTSFNDSTNDIGDNIDFSRNLIVNNVATDAMSMSFYQTDDKSNLFDDLNKVQVLPDNLDEFLNKINADDNSEFASLNNDERIIQTTDLDKMVDINDDNEKELASPNSYDEELAYEPQQEKSLKNKKIIESKSSLLDIEEDSNKTPQLPDICKISEQLKSNEFKSEIEEFEQIEEANVEDCHLSKSPVPGNNAAIEQNDDLVTEQLNEPCDLLKENSQEFKDSIKHEFEFCDLTKKPQTDFEKQCDIPKTHDFKDMIENIDEEIKDISKDVSIEDITSSVKDQTSPPQTISPLPTTELINETSGGDGGNAGSNPIPQFEDSLLISTDEVPDLISLPKMVQDDTESVATTDVNSFLNRSDISEVTSPLSPNYERMEQHLNEFVMNKSEQNRVDVILSEPVINTTAIPKNENSIQVLNDEQKPEISTNVIAVHTAAATTAVSDTKCRPKTASANKITTKLLSSPVKTTKMVLSAKTSRPTVTASKPTIASKTKPSNASKPPLKPHTSTNGSITKSPEKKPAVAAVTNGDVKTRTNLTMKKTTDLPNKTLTTLKPKISPLSNKITRPTTASVSKTANAFSATVGGAISKVKTGTATKTGSSTLAPKKTITSTRVSTLKTLPSTKPTIQTTTTKLRPATAPQIKPKVSTTTASKNLLNTDNKTTNDGDKRIKDTANVLTAALKNATSKTSALNSVRNVVKKTEALKPSGTRTTTKTTSTTTTAITKLTTIAKKPSTRTKTTKIESPQQNCMSAVITEQITIVNNAEQQLIKDNSPIVDNKFVESTVKANNSD